MTKPQQVWQKPKKGTILLKQVLCIALVAAIIPCTYSTSGPRTDRYDLTQHNQCITIESKRYPRKYPKNRNDKWRFRETCTTFVVSFKNPFDVASSSLTNCEEQDFVQIQPGTKKSGRFDETLPKYCGKSRPADVTFTNTFFTNNRILFSTSRTSSTGKGFNARVCMTCQEPTDQTTARTTITEATPSVTTTDEPNLEGYF